jgi:hypothetical protein
MVLQSPPYRTNIMVPKVLHLSYYDAFVGLSIIDHYNGYEESSLEVYYDELLEPSIQDYYNGLVKAS